MLSLNLVIQVAQLVSERKKFRPVCKVLEFFPPSTLVRIGDLWYAPSSQSEPRLPHCGLIYLAEIVCIVTQHHMPVKPYEPKPTETPQETPPPGARSHPPETLLHSRGKGRQSVPTVRCPARRAKAGGRESASRFLLGPLATGEAALLGACCVLGVTVNGHPEQSNRKKRCPARPGFRWRWRHSELQPAPWRWPAPSRCLTRPGWPAHDKSARRCEAATQARSLPNLHNSFIESLRKPDIIGLRRNNWMSLGHGGGEC